MKQGAIGILGGMGSIATADFFMRLVRAFPAEKEWDRPRIVVDNACQMPSRVRAILYGERREELIDALASGIAGLAAQGCTDVALCCNTSHVFLPEALAKARAPSREPHVWHILRLLGEELRQGGVTRASLIATEGTILSGIYEQTLAEYGVTVDCEGESAFGELRELIEAVKQDAVDEAAIERFIALVERQPNENVILGCTEFPILRGALGKREATLRRRLRDPLDSTIAALKNEFLGLGAGRV